MGEPRFHRLRSFGVAILAFVMAMVVLSNVTVRKGVGTPILVFFFAILVSAWYGGLWPGLFVTGLVLATTIAEFTPERTVRFVLFLLCGASISLLLEGLHAARRKIERNAGELDASREQLRQLMESITDHAIFTTDRDGRVTSWSPGARRILGHAEAEVLGHPTSLFLEGGGESPASPAEGRPTTQGDGAPGRDVWCVRRDGTRFCAWASSTPLGPGGAAGTTWVLRDVTERHRAEAELRTAKELAESASQTKDQFLAALSHELRTPLTPVLVTVSALLEDPETSDDLRTGLEIIHRNIVLEARLIDDLLDVTRITRGKLRLNRELTDAHDLIRRAVEICRDEIASSDLELELNLSAVEHHVEADSARFQQIVWNLIKNAVKFTPKGGRITIRTSNQQDAAEGASRTRLIVDVIDTGIGIDAAALESIFSAFEQGNSGDAKQFGGLGLGLSISRSLAEALGGRLTALSAGKDQGAAFTLDLPSVKTPQDALPRPAVRRPASAVEPLHILLVEDNEDTLRVMTRLLRRRGYRVSTATCLAAALAAADEPFDLLVSDIGLPDGSGLELMRYVRRHRAAPGIALSGFGMEEDQRKSREAGFTLHLTKPVDFPTLEEAIQQTLAAVG